MNRTRITKVAWVACVLATVLTMGCQRPCSHGSRRFA